MEDKISLELWISPTEYERWCAVAEKFYMNVYEFIRKSTAANASLLTEEFGIKTK